MIRQALVVCAAVAVFGSDFAKAQDPTTVFYVNGIRDTKKSSELSHSKLEEELRADYPAATADIEFELAHNYSAKADVRFGGLIDLYESFLQAAPGLNPSLFYRFIGGIGVLPDDLHIVSHTVSVGINSFERLLALTPWVRWKTMCKDTLF